MALSISKSRGIYNGKTAKNDNIILYLCLGASGASERILKICRFFTFSNEQFLHNKFMISSYFMCIITKIL